jgi:hypothetical protein
LSRFRPLLLGATFDTGRAGSSCRIDEEPRKFVWIDDRQRTKEEPVSIWLRSRWNSKSLPPIYKLPQQCDIIFKTKNQMFMSFEKNKMYIIVTKNNAIDAEVENAMAPLIYLSFTRVMQIGRKVGRSIVGDKFKWSGD